MAAEVAMDINPTNSSASIGRQIFEGMPHIIAPA